MDTFFGRVQYFVEVCSPEKSFYADDQVQQMLKETRALETERTNADGKVELTP